MIFFIFFIISAQLAGMEKKFPGEEVTIYADEYIYSPEEGIYFFGGGVLIRGKDFEIGAESALYDEVERKIMGYGDVRMRSGGEWIKGEELEFEVDSGRGRIVRGEGGVKGGVYLFQAEELLRKGEMHYELSCGGFTPCRCRDGIPSWSIEGEKMELREDWFIIKKGKFSVKGTPLFHFPYFAVPVVRERKTGFLIPRFAYSDAEGFQVFQPFFWAMDEDKDLTLEAQTFSARGIGAKGVFRYAIPHDGFLNVKASYFNETMQDKRNRYFFEGNGVVNFRSISWYFDGKLPGDRKYLRDFGVYIQEVFLPEIESRMRLSYGGLNHGETLWMKYIENLRNPERDAEVFPGLRASLYSFTIGESFHIKGDVLFRNYIFEGEGGFNRELAFLPEFSVSPGIADFIEFYAWTRPSFKISDDREHTFSSGIYSALAMEKVEGKFRHIFKPFIGVVHTFPASMTLSYFEPVRSGITLMGGIKNYFRIRGLRTAAHLWMERNEDDSALRYQAALSPLPYINLNLEGRHSEKEDHISGGVSLNDGRGDRLSAGYFGYRGAYEVPLKMKSVNISSVLRFHPLLLFSATFTLNPAPEKNRPVLSSSVYSISYESPCRCWGMKFTYVDLEGRKHDRFLFSFYLTGIGEFRSL